VEGLSGPDGAAIVGHLTTQGLLFAAFCGRVSRMEVVGVIVPRGGHIDFGEWLLLKDARPELGASPGKSAVNPFTGESTVFDEPEKAEVVEDGEPIGAISYGVDRLPVVARSGADEKVLELARAIAEELDAEVQVVEAIDAEAVLAGSGEVPWSELAAVAGNAARVPETLRAILVGAPDAHEAAVARLDDIHHQGTASEAAIHALPFLVRMLALPWVRSREVIVWRVANILEAATSPEAHPHALEAIDLLLPFLHDPEPTQRWQVARALGRYPERAEELIAALEEALEEEEEGSFPERGTMDPAEPPEAMRRSIRMLTGEDVIGEERQARKEDPAPDDDSDGPSAGIGRFLKRLLGGGRRPR